ncbi:MAG: sulfotransferase family protein, partial [Gammaproteobacteria bacterium]
AAATLSRTYKALATGQVGEHRFSVATTLGNLPFVGMILDAMPGARVLDCRRERHDLTQRIYFKRYVTGNEYAYALEDIRAFVSQYESIMAHWAERHPGRVLQVCFEDLVRHPARSLEGIRRFCGIDDRAPPGVEMDETEIGCGKPYLQHLS